jgi:hypothetical protein
MFNDPTTTAPKEMREEYDRMKKRLELVREGIMKRGKNIPYDLKVQEEILRANIAHYAVLWGFTD